MTKQRCSPEILKSIKLVGSPTISSDGEVIVGAVETINESSTGYQRELWAFSPDKAEKLLLEVGPSGWSDTAPLFSPTGDALAFISDRSGRRQAYLLDSIGGEVCSLGEVDGDVTSLTWVDDESIIAISDRLPMDEAIGDPRVDGAPIRIYWLRYKSEGQSSYFEPISDIWKLSKKAEPKIIVRCLGKVTNVAAGKGKVAYAVQQRHSDLSEGMTEVRTFDIATGKDDLLWSCPSTIEGLVVTDRSSQVFAVSAGARGLGPVVPRVWQLSDSKSPELAFSSLDVECEYGVQGDCRPSAKAPRLQPVRGSDEIAFVATVEGDVALYIGRGSDPLPRRITPTGYSVTDFSSICNSHVALCLETPITPTEMYLGVVDLDRSEGMTLKLRSSLNSTWVKNLNPVRPEMVHVKGEDGLDLSGLLYVPSSENRIPLLVSVHGGPHLCYGSGFDLEAQIEVNAGYGVLMPNPRGSAGKGSYFRSLSVGEWGGKDYDEVMGFVDQVADDSRIDRRLLYLAGGSYGGYLTNWILTKTDRFRAAISERSISNLLSKYGTADNGFTVNRHEMAGADLFDEGIDVLVERSPLFGANKITTPVLLIHGEQDRRCPIEQSEQLFVALRRLGKKAVFVRFPGEGHSLPYSGRPDHRIQRLELILSWLNEHQ